MVKHSTKAAEMRAHQSAIICAARNYEGTMWVANDCQFRREALAQNDLNWSVVNSQLYSEAFTTRARVIPRCYCLSELHDLPACPSNPDILYQNRGSFSPHMRSAKDTVSRNYDDRKCHYNHCKYQHLCREYRGPHPWFSCSKKHPTRGSQWSRPFQATTSLVHLCNLVHVWTTYFV